MSSHWRERNPERDPDPRIRAIHRDLFPVQGDVIPLSGGYDEAATADTVMVAGNYAPRGDRLDPSDRAFMTEGGWSIADAASDYGNDQRRGGITYREPEPGEMYVDEAAVIEAVQARLGFTVEDVQAVYVRGGGPISGPLKALRTEIDGRLLALLNEGTNMTALAHVLGIGERTMDSAIARAKGVQP